jgi:hypothetical protein
MHRFKSHFSLAGLLLLWEHWLTFKFQSSTIGLIRRLFRRGKSMSPEAKGNIGTVGSWDVSFAAGKATLSAQAAVEGGAVSVGANVTGDAVGLLKAIFAAVNAKLPAGAAPIEAAVEGLIITAVQAIQ